jgi:hypothetical protein
MRDVEIFLETLDMNNCRYNNTVKSMVIEQFGEKYANNGRQHQKSNP